MALPFNVLSLPGKNIRWDPANPIWDLRCVPGGIPPFSGGIPPGIMEHPAWDPTWDYGTSRMGSHMGSRQLKLGFRQLKLGSRLKFLIASRQSHLGSHVGLWNIPRGIPHGIPHGILPIEVGIPPQIPNSIPLGKAHPRQD